MSNQSNSNQSAGFCFVINSQPKPGFCFVIESANAKRPTVALELSDLTKSVQF
jgi:hypothetical protein